MNTTDDVMNAETTVDAAPPPLPTLLANRKAKQMAAAVIIAVISVAGTIAVSPRLLILLVFAAYFAYLSLETEHNYRSGEIVETVLICTGAKRCPLQDRSIITFKSPDDVPTYYQFTIQGRNKSALFIPSDCYCVYYSKSRPDILMEYVQV